MDLHLQLYSLLLIYTLINENLSQNTFFDNIYFDNLLNQLITLKNVILLDF